MKINWKVRIKNKNFWITLIPAVLILVQRIFAVIGVSVEIGDIQGKLIAVVGAVFAVLAILGVIQDPTTEGLEDSNLAMTYDEPKRKGD